MTSERHTRRSFLKGRSAADALAELANRASAERSSKDTVADVDQVAPAPPLDVDRGLLLVSVRRRAMACEWEVQMAATRNDDSMEHVFKALDLVEALEAQMTVYRDDSEMLRINREASLGPVPIEPRLFEVFQLAQRVYQETDGALDISSGPLSDVWGFSRRRGRVPHPAEIADAILRVGMGDVVLDEAAQTIAFRRPGLTVNLNSMGKGYALDRMADLLGGHDVNDYLLHGGKSSVLARGDHPGHPPGSGWKIGLRHPLRPAERLAEFCLRDGALSTSGSGTQYFRRRGRLYGHILDPRTGQPTEGVYSATVLAPTAVEAEALSTAFYVLGPERTGTYCAAQPRIAAALVCPGSRDGSVRLHAFGLKAGQWEQFADH